MAAVDPYRVLGLEPGASQPEVKRAYRRLAKALHPDAAGEHALPAFLALQDAYEQLTGTRVRTVRPSDGPAGTGARGRDGTPRGASDSFREPWRADPARARAAREQARTRRTWPGGQRGPTGWTEAGGPSRSAAGPEPSHGTGSRPRRAAGSTSSGTAGARRSTRKATLGSTSYDDARDPGDRSWAGASWYGPTTGEYWHVNPREYADPRKHGPGYSSRGRSGPAATMGAAATMGGSTPAPARPMASSTASDGPPRGGPAGDTLGPLGDTPGALGQAWPANPGRRLGLVLLAWPPLGLAAATLIGDTTGCATYSTACDGIDRLLPWLAQAMILGILLIAPAVARVLAGGTMAALLAALPGAALITALGGAGSAQGPVVLAGWLILAWAGGVVWGLNRAVRGSSSGGWSRRAEP
jgi:hypothetical protein